MIAISLIEVLIPLQRRTSWNSLHLIPNLTLTLVTFAIGATLNVAILFGLVAFERGNVGLLNLVALPDWIEIGLAILVLDLAWYVTHVSLHRYGWMWRYHSVHHSDPAVDVTTSVRQHPGETLIRYVYTASFAFAAGASPAAFAIYRVWSVLNALLEHANIRLPNRLDAAIATVIVSPDTHKIHHSMDRWLHDSNFANIFTLWDRVFGTWTDRALGRDVDYGLAGYDNEERQRLEALLTEPHRKLRET
jgi:sterol desaturase/sphingolipid hydroxylase (fatty acid hydroxylase superfamily)